MLCCKGCFRVIWVLLVLCCKGCFRVLGFLGLLMSATIGLLGLEFLFWSYKDWYSKVEVAARVALVGPVGDVRPEVISNMYVIRIIRARLLG